MTQILLLPGLDGTGQLFSEFVSAWGDRSRVVVGHYPVDEALTFDELVDHAAAFVPREGRFVILGESFSGPIAVALALRFQHRLDALVLCATFVAPPLPLLSLAARLADVLSIGSIPRGLLAFALLGRWRAPGLAEQIERAVASVNSTVLASRVRILARCDVSASLSQITVPVLNLRAGDDRLVGIWCADKIDASCSDAKRVVIQGPHCLLQACPQESVTEVSAFIKRVLSAR